MKGLLVENTSGATIRGTVYDRSLRLVHESGYEFAILDDSYPVLPISRHIQTGQTYEFIVMAAIGTHTLYFPKRPPVAYLKPLTYGIIASPDWRAPLNPHHHYRYYNPRLYHNAGGFVLVETQYGNILFGPDDISAGPGEGIQNGAYVCWQELRLELLAIL
jgi:hypothetical protein